MQLLLESGSDVNVKNDNSETPLMVALYRLSNKDQREKAIKLLCESGADVNLKNGQGRSALMYACGLDQPDSVRLLLQQVRTNLDIHPFIVTVCRLWLLPALSVCLSVCVSVCPAFTVYTLFTMGLILIKLGENVGILIRLIV